MLNGLTPAPPSPAAREAKFRLQAPNATARDILVIPLDAASARCTEALQGLGVWNARFVPFSPAGGAWRAALAECRPDLVVMVGQAGENLSQAIAVGEVCAARQIKISGVLIRDDFPDIWAGLRSLRPWTQTLAVVTDAEYLAGLLQALGA